MNAPTIPVTEILPNSILGSPKMSSPNGDDLPISRVTDFYGLDELLTDQEREMRDRVPPCRSSTRRRTTLWLGHFLSATDINSDANAILSPGGVQNNYSNDDNRFRAI